MRTSIPLGERRYVPRASSNTLKLIVEDHLEELREVYDDRFRDTYGPLHLRVLDLLERFLCCGDPHSGFFLLRCPEGHEERIPRRIEIITDWTSRLPE